MQANNQQQGSHSGSAMPSMRELFKAQNQEPQNPEITKFLKLVKSSGNWPLPFELIVIHTHQRPANKVISGMALVHTETIKASTLEKADRIVLHAHVLWFLDPPEPGGKTYDDAFPNSNSSLGRAALDYIRKKMSELDSEIANRINDVEVSIPEMLVIPLMANINADMVNRVLGRTMELFHDAIQNPEDRETEVDQVVRSLQECRGIVVQIEHYPQPQNDLLGFNIREDVRLTVTSREFDRGHRMAPVEFTLFSIGGYIELTPSGSVANASMPWKDTGAKYVPRFVVSNFKSNSPFSASSVMFALGLTLVNQYMQSAQWVGIFEEGETSSGRTTYRLPMPKEMPCTDSIYQAVVAKLMPIIEPGHLISVDIPVNPTVDFGLNPNDPESMKTLLRVVSDLLARSDREEVYRMFSRSVTLELADMVFGVHHRLDSRFGNALYILNRRDSVESIQHNYEDSMFLDHNNDAINMSSGLGLPTPESVSHPYTRRCLLEELGADLSPAHNLAQRYDVSVKGIQELSQAFWSIDGRCLWRGGVQLRPKVRPGRD